jgi:DNA-binding transcriptional regulator LsrR (DeoR family)
MTQAELADALGLSVVHTNRVLQDLRAQGLVTLKGKTLVIPDLDALMAAGLFNPNYLHLDRDGQAFDANEAQVGRNAPQSAARLV